MDIIKRFYKHVVFFVLLFLLLNSTINYFFQRQQEEYLTAQTELLQKQYAIQYSYLKIMSQDIYSMYRDNEKLIDLLTKADNAKGTQKDLIRQEVYNLLKKRYKRLVNMGVKQLHFHTKNNISFLRMHAPEKFGDDLSKIRESVAYVNKNQKKVEGFELGVLNHGFRFVYPLFSKDGAHIGSMEVSFSSKQLVSYINDKFIIDKHILIAKKQVRKMNPQIIEKLYTNSFENRDYLTTKTTASAPHNKKFQSIIQENTNSRIIKDSMKKSIPFSLSSSYNYNSISLTFIPMSGITHSDSSAYLVLYTESDYLDTLLLENHYAIVLLIAILSLLFLFSIYITITQRRLKLMAHFDKLTELPNRAYFYIGLEHEFKRAKRLNQKLSLMFIDLDGFKLINDTYGHNAGDTLLIETARRLQKSIRSMDMVARIGGDEFIILLTDVKDDANTAKIAKKIIDNLNEEFKINKNLLHVGASIGVASYPDNAKNMADLVSYADAAMYAAKNSGKNRFIIYKQQDIKK